MAILRIFPSTSGPAATQADTDNYTLGVEFRVQSAATATAVFLWRPATAPATTFTVALYRIDGPTTGTLLGSVAGNSAPANANGWHRVQLSSPIALTALQAYRAVVFSTTDNFYAATPQYWTGAGPGASGITNGILTAVNTTEAANGAQGSFIGGSALAFPNTGFNATNYWIDVEVDDGSVSSNTGTLSAALPRARSTISGSAANAGSVSRALPRASASLAGTSTNPGATGASTPRLTAVLSGSSANPGVLSASAPRITGSLTGEARNSGSLDASAPLVATSIEQEATSTALLDAELPRASWSSVGESRNSGSLNASMPLVASPIQGSQTNSGSMSVAAFLLDLDVDGSASNSGDLESVVSVLETAIDGSMVNSGSLDVSVLLVEPGLFGDSIVTGSLNAELSALEFSIEDLGGRRDITVLNVSEVPTTVVTVAEIARSVVIQEIS